MGLHMFLTQIYNLFTTKGRLWVYYERTLRNGSHFFHRFESRSTPIFLGRGGGERGADFLIATAWVAFITTMILHLFNLSVALYKFDFSCVSLHLTFMTIEDSLKKPSPWSNKATSKTFISDSNKVHLSVDSNFVFGKVLLYNALWLANKTRATFVTNDLLARVFRRLASVTCICAEFWLAHFAV